MMDDDEYRIDDALRRCINISKVVLCVGLLITIIGINKVIVSSVYLAIIQHSTPVDDELKEVVQQHMDYEESSGDLEHYMESIPKHYNLDYDEETSGDLEPPTYFLR